MHCFNDLVCVCVCVPCMVVHVLYSHPNCRSRGRRACPVDGGDVDIPPGHSCAVDGHHQAQASNSFFGLSIGMTIVTGAITTGHTSSHVCVCMYVCHGVCAVCLSVHSIAAISGGVFNPAMGTGIPTVLTPPLHCNCSDDVIIIMGC